MPQRKVTLSGPQIKDTKVRVYIYNSIMYSVLFKVCGILSDDRPVLILQSCRAELQTGFW